MNDYTLDEESIKKFQPLEQQINKRVREIFNELYFVKERKHLSTHQYLNIDYGKDSVGVSFEDGSGSETYTLNFPYSYLYDDNMCKFCEYKALCDPNYTVPDTEYTTDKKTGLPKVKSSTDNKEEDKTSE